MHTNNLAREKSPAGHRPPSMRRQLFSRFVVALMAAQFVFLVIVSLVVYGLLQRQQSDELELRTQKAIELFGNLARYGDVRYAKFVVLSNGVANGLMNFRVHDMDGEEIQASDPQNASSVAPDMLVSGKGAVSRAIGHANPFLELLAQQRKGDKGTYTYFLKTSDGSTYLITAAMKGKTPPWGMVSMAMLGLVAFSSLFALFLARGWVKTVAESMDDYAGHVRNITVQGGTDLKVPYSELAPVQDALAAMVRDLREQAKLAAIARMTAMLAHDIRKPFTMLKMGIDRMAAVGDDPAVARALALNIREHVGKAFENVNGMLADVMEISSGNTSLQMEPHSLRLLLSGVLEQVFRYDPGCDVAFEYDFDHAHQLYVDQLKVQRILANILDNARQALKGKGRIWIRSREYLDQSMIEITLGNSDSVIPVADLPHLFEAFFTKGKHGGTGLGLAICHKIATDHGGTICCKSSQKYGTEFVITLPLAAGSRDSAVVHLPVGSVEVRASFEAAFHEDRGGKSEMGMRSIDLPLSIGIG